MELKYFLLLLEFLKHTNGMSVFDIMESIICDVEVRETTFYLFTKENIHKARILNSTSPKNIFAKRKTVLIIHGFRSSYLNPSIASVKDEYLKRYDYNVIMVDWSKIANENYLLAVCKLYPVSKILANFLCRLTKDNNITMESVHLLGHSLGAHVSGQAGLHTVQMCNKKIGRITGLDPAGPLFQHGFKHLRLDKFDATFVDVIHTNEFLVGYGGNCGTVDFHVNCGTFQRPCPGIDIWNSFASTVQSLRCNHLESIQYFKESIHSDQFIAKSCSKCPEVCKDIDENPEYIIMGEDCPKNSTKHVFFVPTNKRPPYARGWAPYQNNNGLPFKITSFLNHSNV